MLLLNGKYQSLTPLADPVEEMKIMIYNNKELGGKV